MTFPYQGCTFAYNNSEWAALYQNICEVWRWWTMVGDGGEKYGVSGTGTWYAVQGSR